MRDIKVHSTVSCALFGFWGFGWLPVSGGHLSGPRFVVTFRGFTPDITRNPIRASIGHFD